jgi:poly(A) polymerase
MPEGATKKLAHRVVRRLRSRGHESLLAGGCVRDMLLGHRPADYDVATSATPKQVKKIFGHVLMVGAKFGVAMVIQGSRRIEVATFRTDLSYSDGRRPDGVKFVSAREDALRRDFTINGMFYDPIEDKVVDYVNGQADLKAGVIRAIGDPALRFDEDYLRMLRAVRFSAKLGFPIEPATAAAIRDHAAKIAQISGERIRDELEKMLVHRSAAKAVDQLHELGLLASVLGELYTDPGDLTAALVRVRAVARQADPLLTLAALMCRLDPKTLAAIARRWGASNKMRDSLIWIAERLDTWQTLSEASLADLKRVLAHRAYGQLKALWRLREREATGGHHACEAIARRAGRIRQSDISPRPLVAGGDLMKLGLPQGDELGHILRQLYDEQLNEILTGRRQALRRARELVAAKTGA